MHHHDSLPVLQEMTYSSVAYVAVLGKSRYSRAAEVLLFSLYLFAVCRLWLLIAFG